MGKDRRVCRRVVFPEGKYDLTEHRSIMHLVFDSVIEPSSRHADRPANSWQSILVSVRVVRALLSSGPAMAWSAS
jgi:hypothetical protein